MSTLDTYLPPTAVKVKEDPQIAVEENYSNFPRCQKKVGITEPKYTVRVKGKDRIFCRECALEILPKPKPKENSEEKELE